MNYDNFTPFIESSNLKLYLEVSIYKATYNAVNSLKLNRITTSDWRSGCYINWSTKSD